MKIYTLIGGVNGSGKSSLTGVLNADRNDLGAIVDPDKIAMEEQYSTVGAGKAAIRRIESYLHDGITFTQETTLSGRRVVNTVKRAKELGYLVRLFYVGLNTVDESLKRIRNRVERGGHNIPTPDVERRFNDRFATLLAILPYCDEGTFFDNENGFQAVAQYKNGRIATLTEHKPLWLKELLKKERVYENQFKRPPSTHRALPHER
ncbi:hypothetical protein [Ethanoligenens sp.]|uniref:hypothetical protein n=1 Tax=Ethanoligenens sp. TaxID=2099655 RepID=UPI0039E7B7BF